MTCREVYNRIRWDQRIDSTAVKVGIEDRFRGTVEVDFHDARLGADVPWHRIQHFSYLGQVVWNRQGLDLLDSTASELPTLANTMCQWNRQRGEWAASEVEPHTLPDIKVRLLSLNVLFDLYDKDIPTSESRFPALLDLLKAENTELVALQEVTPKLLSLILKDPWVQDNYTISQPPGGPDLAPYGQLLLSTLSCSVEYRELVAGKTVLQAGFSFASGPVQLTVLHLYSDRKAEAQSKRLAQLEEVQSYLSPESAHWLVGDFNEVGRIQISGFRDVWSTLRPGDFGFTFDPVTNPLAKQTSVRGLQARFDRVLLKGPWAASKVELRSTDHSDHHALLCELSPPLLAEPVHHSALVLIPPKKLWPPIQAIRKVHDKSFQRWMPHINLLYGFVPEASFEQAQQLLKACLSNVARFTMRLREYQRFQHKATTTVWLHPECDPPEAIGRLQRTVQDLFPRCLEQSGRSDSGYTAHLTVANLKKGSTEPELPRIDLTFDVEELALISREADTSFQIQAHVALGSPPLERCLPTEAKTPKLGARLRERLEALSLEFYPVGSAALNLGLPNSDLDLVVLGHSEAESVYGEFPEGRIAPGRVKVLKLQDADNPVDLQYCQYPSDIELKAPELLTPEEFQSLGPQAQTLAQARRDVCRLKNHLEHPNGLPLLRLVRLWTKARSLDRQAFGYPGGLAWAILVAWTLEGARDDATLEELVHHFFLSVEQWPWPQALVLNTELKAHCSVQERDRLPIFSLTRPAQNVANYVTPGTREIVAQELRRAQALCTHNRWEQLFDPLPWTGGMEHSVPLEKKGWLEGQVLDLLLGGEKQGQWLRAHSFVESPTKVTLRVLCSPEPPHHLMSL